MQARDSFLTGSELLDDKLVGDKNAWLPPARCRAGSLPGYQSISPSTHSLSLAPLEHISTPNFKVGWGIDSSAGFVLIGREVWVIFNLGNQYGTTVKVARFKGTDVEHTEHQPDGVVEVGEQGVSIRFCGGMWYKRWDGKKYYDNVLEERGARIARFRGWRRKRGFSLLLQGEETGRGG